MKIPEGYEEYQICFAETQRDRCFRGSCNCPKELRLKAQPKEKSKKVFINKHTKTYHIYEQQSDGRYLEIEYGKSWVILKYYNTLVNTRQMKPLDWGKDKVIDPREYRLQKSLEYLEDNNKKFNFVEELKVMQEQMLKEDLRKAKELLSRLDKLEVTPDEFSRMMTEDSIKSEWVRSERSRMGRKD